MRITAQEEYGLRCMLQLARRAGGEPLTIAEISQREALSLPYVGKLMALLRHAGLAGSVRGRAGGYVLPRPPSEIRLDEIIETLGGELFEEEDHCDRYPAGETSCVHVGDCSIRSVWSALGDLIRDVLRRTTLADLLRSEGQLSRQLSQIMTFLPKAHWPYGSGAPGEVVEAITIKTDGLGGKA